MAITGVMRIGVVALRVLDLETCLRHYRDVLGLRLVARDATRAYLKGWDEHDHHSLVLRQADQAGNDYCAFKVRRPDDLDRFRGRLEALGVAVQDLPDQPYCGPAIGFTTPSGHAIQLYAEMAQVGNGLSTHCPEFEPDDIAGAAVTRMEHCLLYGPNVAETEQLFMEALDFSVSERLNLPDGSLKATFLACSTKMHDVAFIAHPQPGMFHHVSFWIDSDAALMRAANLFGRHQVTIDEGPTQHGIGRARTIYFWDPSGNRNEVFGGSYLHYPDKPVLTWGAEELGKALSYPQRRVNQSFLTVVT